MKSKNLFLRAQNTLVGGVNSPVRSFKSVGGVPRFIERGKGCRLTDADGGVYVDYCLSWGPLILGHCHPQVTAAAFAQIKKGSSYGAPTRLEVELAEAITEAIPSMEKIRCTSSGTEAVMSALRLARAFTGRAKVLKFAGGYHGHVDSLLVSAGSGAASFGTPDSAGVPTHWAQDTLVLPYNDAQALEELFAAQGPAIACAIVEPVAANMGVVPPEPGFLESLRRLTRQCGALLIFDEVITGFRVRYGGYQDALGIRPDLTCLGKVIGGGFPVGAFGGKREIMDMLAPLGPVYQAGTLSGNPAAMAAGLATLKILKKTDPYRRLAEKTQMLARGISAAALKKGAAVQVSSAGSFFTAFFSERPVRDFDGARACDAARYAKFFHALLKNGVYFPPAQLEAAFVSTAHGARDLDLTLKAVETAIGLSNK
ncbi:MAG: glutamate-1-semialdehyde 2,1-aminomutase [Elusimicrobia bacterium]|nr:glutamate-1-semialdehyde 2,1-aminomutase [Elusimicrobiota bacterium]